MESAAVPGTAVNRVVLNSTLVVAPEVEERLRLLQAVEIPLRSRMDPLYALYEQARLVWARAQACLYDRSISMPSITSSMKLAEQTFALVTAVDCAVDQLLQYAAKVTAQYAMLIDNKVSAVFSREGVSEMFIKNHTQLVVFFANKGDKQHCSVSDANTALSSLCDLMHELFTETWATMKDTPVALNVTPWTSILEYYSDDMARLVTWSYEEMERVVRTALINAVCIDDCGRVVDLVLPPLMHHPQMRGLFNVVRTRCAQRTLTKQRNDGGDTLKVAFGAHLLSPDLSIMLKASLERIMQVFPYEDGAPARAIIDVILCAHTPRGDYYDWVEQHTRRCFKSMDPLDSITRSVEQWSRPRNGLLTNVFHMWGITVGAALFSCVTQHIPLDSNQTTLVNSATVELFSSFRGFTTLQNASPLLSECYMLWMIMRRYRALLGVGYSEDRLYRQLVADFRACQIEGVGLVSSGYWTFRETILPVLTKQQ